MPRMIKRPVFKFSAFSALACATAALAAHGETVGFWPFDDGTPTNTAASLSTVTGTVTLDATASGIGSGRPPAFNADTAGTNIWDNMTAGATSHTDMASLRFVNAGLPANTNSGYGGCAVVPDSALLRLTNLTVEAFVKVDRRVNWPLIVGKQRTDGNGTSWSLDLDNAGRPRVRIDSQPIGASSGSGWNQTWTSPASIEDGGWHHLALCYTQTNKAVKLYVDRILRASGNSFNNLVYDTRELRIGQGCGDRAFDGWIDGVRVSDAALTPELFMTADSHSDVLGYWTFDDSQNAGATAGTLTNTYCFPLMNGTAAAAGGSAPVFSPETPAVETRRISSGTNGPIVNADNAMSLRFTNAGLPGNTNSTAGGQVSIPGSVIVQSASNLTVEAFIKVAGHVNYSQIIGKMRSATGGMSWCLGVNASGNFRARIDSQVPPSAVGFNQCLESTASVEDGKWHHVAMTYDASSLNVNLYVDHRKVYEKALTGPIVMDSGDIRIGSGDRAFDGWIDEARITDRVLSPDEFLCSAPVVGSVTAIQ